MKDYFRVVLDWVTALALSMLVMTGLMAVAAVAGTLIIVAVAVYSYAVYHLAGGSYATESAGMAIFVLPFAGALLVVGVRCLRDTVEEIRDDREWAALQVQWKAEDKAAAWARGAQPDYALEA